MLNVEELLKRLKKKREDRARCSLYLSKAVMKDFKSACKKITLVPSQIIEEWMDEFVEQVKRRKA